MAKSIERVTLLVPLAIVTGITLAAALVVLSPTRSTPAVQAALEKIASDSEKSPISVDALPTIAAVLGRVEGVGLVRLSGHPVAGVRARSIDSQICATVQTTSGPITLCADTRAPNALRWPVSYIAAAAIAAALLGAIVATFLARRAILAFAQTVDARAPSAASGSLGTLSTSVNRLLTEAHENEVALRRRGLELESANKELEAFTFSASHDLRAPLASIDGFSQMLLDDSGEKLDDTARDCVTWIRDACLQMQELVDGLLQMSRFSRADLDREDVDLSAMARAVAEGLRQREPQREVTFRIQDGVKVHADPRLMRAVLENLLGNAWKFTRKHPTALIEFGASDHVIFVRDDGAGFDPGYADKMFRAFQRLHSRQEFEGTGIGLATVERIVHRHGGRIWAEGDVEKGATFFFTAA